MCTVVVQVLRLALDNVLSKWKQARDYEWCSDQFKAIRQDLTLQVSRVTVFVCPTRPFFWGGEGGSCPFHLHLFQNIKDAFAARVYEEHARMALENRDYSNFKQCQGILQGFYNEVRRAGSVARGYAIDNGNLMQGAEGSSTEFTAYSIIYSVCTNRSVCCCCCRRRRRRCCCCCCCSQAFN